MAKKTKKKSRKKTAAVKAASTGLGNISLDELSREMRRREREVGRYISRRDKLMEQVEGLNNHINSLGGPASYGGFGMTAAGRPRRRPHNEQSLSESLISVLKGKTMSVTDAAESVQKAGYQTTSTSFRTIVNQTLIKDPRFKKVSRGQYTAK